MDNGHTFWGRFTGDDITETLCGYKCELPVTCECGIENEWIRLDEFASFWGCKKCLKRESVIKLINKVKTDW